MKKVSLRAVLILSAFLFIVPLNAQFIRGNGEVTKQMHNVENFDAIKVGGARTVILTQGDSVSVVVETDSNLQEYITLEVKDGTLHFGFKSKKIMKYKVLKFYITAPDYKSIRVSGASKVVSTGTLNGDQLQISTSGASDLKLDVDYKNIITRVSGASDVMLSGTTTSNEVTCSGASEFHGKNLASDIVVAIVGGASNCFVDAKSNLTYDVSGSSEFQYKSTPETVVVKKGKAGNDVIVLSNTNFISKHHAYPDTTDVSVGSLNFTVVDGDTTLVTVGRHTLVVSDNGDVKWRKSNRDKFNGHWGGFELGLNGYLTPDFNMSFDTKDDYLSLQMEKSINVNLNIYEQNISLNKGKNIGLVTGIGVSWNNYRFSKPTYLTNDSSAIAGYYMNGVSVRKTKLTAMYITVPLFFEIQTKNERRINQFHFAVGALINARISTHTKIYFNEANKAYNLLDPVSGNIVANGLTPTGGSRNIVKDFNSFHLAPFKFDVSVRFGYGIINLYATYSLNTMFQENRGPELYPFTAGITLVGW